MSTQKPKPGEYARKAAGWTDAAYADASAYLDHRAELIASLGGRLAAADHVLDLACGDGGLGEHLLARGLGYTGVDVEPAMVEAARTRLGDRAAVEVGDLTRYAPAGPVAVTTVFRAIYYADDRAAFFARVAGFTEKKLVFDLNPRQFHVADVTSDLAVAGFRRIELRPFFVPQSRRLPSLATGALKALERTGPLARLALRARFTYLVAAVR